MSRALRVIGTIAGAVALVATGVGAFAVGAKAVAVAGQVAKIATVVGGVASVGAALTQKAPPARGSVTQVLISPDAPQPYVMGEGLFAGVLRHDTAYGATLNKVPNPYRFMPIVYSGGGPIESITPYVDQGTVSSWYSTFLYTDTQLGAVPESDALVPQFAGAPGWSTASKLSGKAAIGWSLKFDKDGKRFASGVPQLGAFGKWVKVYDPRKDSTFPGGSGAHRLGMESTYEWSENPALHCGTYAYGRYQNSKRVMGVGMPSDAIDWTTIAAWANVCDANVWTIFGAVYEPGDRWANLRDIAIAGGGEPVFAGGVLSFKYAAPKVPLDTIVEADLSDDDQSVTAMASWRDRINTVIPKYRSPVHNWELVAGDEVAVAEYVTEDGERKAEEYPFNFVKKPDQAEQLAAYRLVDGRELQPITITCGPRMFAYRPGECLHIDLPFLSLDTDAIILKRDFDPARMTVTFTMIGETPSKHAFALGKNGNPPVTPALGQTGEERDQLSSAAAEPTSLDTVLISSSWTTDIDPADQLAQATNTTITVEAHTRNYSDKQVSVTGGTITTLDDGVTALVASTLYHMYYDDGARVGGAVIYKATLSASDAANSAINTSRHYCGSIFTDAPGGTGTTGGGVFPSGWFIDDWYGF